MEKELKETEEALRHMKLLSVVRSNTGAALPTSSNKTNASRDKNPTQFSTPIMEKKSSNTLTKENKGKNIKKVYNSVVFDNQQKNQSNNMKQNVKKRKLFSGESYLEEF